MTEKHICESCSMPMVKKEEFGGGVVGNRYCVYCTQPDGKLKPRAVVREGMVNFWMKEFKKSRAEAENAVDAHMEKLPAWKRP